MFRSLLSRRTMKPKVLEPPCRQVSLAISSYNSRVASLLGSTHMGGQSALTKAIWRENENQRGL